jgi:DNA-binding NarL/FixJ family response regulator
VLKEGAPEKLFEAVREAAAGRRYLDPAIGARLALQECEAGTDGGSLADREREVVRLLSLGYTCVEVAAQVGRSPRTIEAYRARIMEKLGLETRPISFATRWPRACSRRRPIANRRTNRASRVEGLAARRPRGRRGDRRRLRESDRLR